MGAPASGATAALFSMILAAGCASPSRPEASRDGLWWRDCRRPAMEEALDRALESRDPRDAPPQRADLEAARARLALAVAEAPPRRSGRGLGEAFGFAAHGFTQVVHSGADAGQAQNGLFAPPPDLTAQRRRAEAEAARDAYRRTLAKACREVEGAAQAAEVLEARRRQAAASLADARAAAEALRARGASPAEVEIADHETAVRAARLSELARLAGTARERLTQALGGRRAETVEGIATAPVPIGVSHGEVRPAGPAQPPHP